MEKKLFGQIGRLKREKIDEYIKLHSAVWPEVLETIKACNMRNYSIFIRDDVVFGYFEYIGTDYEADMQKMADDSITQKWWGLTRPCFTKYDADSLEPFYEDMKSIFFYEGN